MTDYDIDTYLNIGFLKSEKENQNDEENSFTTITASKARELTLIAYKKEIDNIEELIQSVANKGHASCKIEDIPFIIRKSLISNGFNVQSSSDSNGSYYIISWE
jgi:hypothetical protein